MWSGEWNRSATATENSFSKSCVGHVQVEPSVAGGLYVTGYCRTAVLLTNLAKLSAWSNKQCRCTVHQCSYNIIAIKSIVLSQLRVK